ncbi:MAG: hypothetical protein ACKPKO_15315, partial [Candidatus Fonsibacter sp.]
MIELTPSQTILYNEVYIDTGLTTDGNIIVGSYTGPIGWTDKFTIAPTGNITTVGGISAGLTGNITGKNGSFQTLSITGSPKQPTPTNVG